MICVTHLPQVAAFADRHARVEKRVAAGRTTTAVVPLDAEGERRAEVARMLAGHTVTASALDHAAALIAGARARDGRKGAVPARAGAARGARGPARGRAAAVARA